MVEVKTHKSKRYTPTLFYREDEEIVSFSYDEYEFCYIAMKKYDKEYSTQYTPEKEYLLQYGIKPSFVKEINEVTTYKYTKTAELFELLSYFYAKDNK